MSHHLGLGALLAVGVLLTAAPWLWPRRATARKPLQFDRIDRLLAEAGYAHVAARVFFFGALASSAVLTAVVWLVTGVPALAVLAVIVGAAAPVVWLRARAVKLSRSRRATWPDACDLLISSVRAGMSLPDAVASLGHSAPAALRPAFLAFERDLNASGHFDASAERLKIRLSDATGDRIVETLRMARQVGGTELTPVLRALSASVRAEASLRGEVEARQSWTRGAAILGVAAPWVIVALLSLRPEGAAAYASREGLLLLLSGAAVSFVAFRVMVRIARLPEPRRWFA